MIRTLTPNATGSPPATDAERRWHLGRWPEGLPEIDGEHNDPFLVHEGALDAAREVVAKVDDAELFLYPGDLRLCVYSSPPSRDVGAAALGQGTRALEFLGGL